MASGLVQRRFQPTLEMACFGVDAGQRHGASQTAIYPQALNAVCERMKTETTWVLIANGAVKLTVVSEVIMDRTKVPNNGVARHIEDAIPL